MNIMLTLRTFILLDNGWRQACSRKLHTSTLKAARPASRKSPRIVAVREAKLGTVQTKSYKTEEAWPPVVLLDAASKSGALDIAPEKALDYIKEYLTEMGTNPSEGWEQKLCEKHSVTPHHMAIIAGILRRCPTVAQRSLSQNLMLAASELGERSATLQIMESGIRTGQAERYEAPLRKLGLLAKKKDDPQAMLLLGRYLKGQHRKGQQPDQESLQWFQRATRPPTGSLDFDGAGEALIEEGRILLNRGDTEGARTAFETAAIELDDPVAYFYLSKLEETGTVQQVVYLLKASASGLTEAFHNLGALEMEKINKQGKKPTSLDDYGLAREYFEIAASDGFGLSMINMATMNKAVGNVNEALVWLENVEELGEENLNEAVQSLRKQWTDEREQSLS